MADRRGPDGELPPDPWARSDDGPPPPPSPPPHGPSPLASGGDRRSLLQHPAVWVGVTVLAVIALLGAALELG